MGGRGLQRWEKGGAKGKRKEEKKEGGRKGGKRRREKETRLASKLILKYQNVNLCVFGNFSFFPFSFT